MTDCILTTYYRNKAGYGQCWFEGANCLHHRAVYCEVNKLSLADIKDKLIRHTCDNPSCVNPTHLIIGTHKDNTQDRIVRGRFSNNSKPKFSSEQIEAIRNSRGSHAETAAAFGTNKQTISDVVNRARAYKDR